MYKNNILNLLLFLVAISLASVIYLSEEESTELDKISNNHIADVTTINIQHNKNTSTIIKSPGGHWNITQPVTIAANDFRVNSILKLINAPVHKQYTSAEIDLDEIGLSNPATTVHFNNQSISFGITNPVTNLRYVKQGDFIYTIQDVYYPLISSHFSTLVSLNLLPVNSSITRLILPNQTIFRDDKGLWHSNTALSADNIVKTIQHWQQDQAFGAHEYLPREQQGEVFIYLKDQQHPVSFIITDTDPWLILAQPELGLEYHLDIKAYKNLITPQ